MAGRNDPCPCGSGRKFKHCCGSLPATPATLTTPKASAGVLDPAAIGALVALANGGQLQAAEQRAREQLGAHPLAAMLWKILSVAQMRQGKDALPALRRASELAPDDAEAQGNLGTYLCERGQCSVALPSLRRALALQPNNQELLLATANALLAIGQARESLGLYQQALQLNPGSAEAHNNLGNAHLTLGESAAAAGAYRRALDLSPNNADILCNLANAQRQLGLLEEALASSRRALELDPNQPVTHNVLGLVLSGLGRHTEAEASYRRALALKPDYVEALNNLALQLPELGQRAEAAALFARAIELAPGRTETLCNLGSLQFEFRKYQDAATSYRRALQLEPRNVTALAGLGAALRMQGHSDEAERTCRAALEINPNCVPALSLLGELHADRGQFTAAEDLFKRAIGTDATFPFGYFSIAANRRMTAADGAWRTAVERLLAAPLPLRHEITLRYALGKYHDDLQQYDAAFTEYRQANELSKHYGVSYDQAGRAARVTRVIATFDSETLRRLQALGQSSERPVFIVGMPRSGTSLCEQILASHPEVRGAGELSFWQAALNSFEAAGFGSPAAAALIPAMAADYLHRLSTVSADAGRVVDKGFHFTALGLIHAALPQARFIHVRRHPVDTCLSIYFQYLSHLHPYANDFDDLAHYYGEYLRLTAHWRAVLPATAYLEIPYEGLIEKPERWSRRMLQFLGLPWDPNVLNFHQTDRVVITLSKWQVRQKISTSSAGRWRNYEKYVGPLLPLVELAERFDIKYGAVASDRIDPQ